MRIINIYNITFLENTVVLKRKQKTRGIASAMASLVRHERMKDIRYPKGLSRNIPPVIGQFPVWLFAGHFRERRLFEKRRHPKTFIIFQ
ncbi:hypothetical protein [Komagataeibacter melaceti]|uniref:hypothetical protein n=1 Tax=Komagataeibacter melaceti TaxID=2766577 RepID=UPI0011E58E4B|nr:hypothetical protein [Komagataeibacter melaceti]